VPEKQIQQNLFYRFDRQKSKRLMEVVDKINAKNELPEVA
jgi:hypothetical protein